MHHSFCFVLLFDCLFVFTGQVTYVDMPEGEVD